MTVETAADLSAYFDTSGFGRAATFTPLAGSPVSVTVILDKPTVYADAGGLSAGIGTIGQLVAKVRESEVTGLTLKAGTLVVGTDTYTVANATLDGEGVIYEMELYEV